MEYIFVDCIALRQPTHSAVHFYVSGMMYAPGAAHALAAHLRQAGRQASNTHTHTHMPTYTRTYTYMHTYRSGVKAKKS